MNCPYCNQEMMQGKIISGRTMYLSLDSAKSIELSYDNWIYPTVDVLVCKKCQKIVIDYQRK